MIIEGFVASLTNSVVFYIDFLENQDKIPQQTNKLEYNRLCIDPSTMTVTGKQKSTSVECRLVGIALKNNTFRNFDKVCGLANNDIRKMLCENDYQVKVYTDYRTDKHKRLLVGLRCGEIDVKKFLLKRYSRIFTE